jgi:hypothetical protein
MMYVIAVFVLVVLTHAARSIMILTQHAWGAQARLGCPR